MIAATGHLRDVQKIKIQPCSGNSGFRKHPISHFIRVGFSIVKMFDPAINEHLGTQYARMIGTIELGTRNICAMFCALDDDVLFSMKTAANLMTLAGWHSQFFPQATRFMTVIQTCGSAIIASGQNTLVFYGYSANLAPQAGGSFSHQKGNGHKVFGPA